MISALLDLIRSARHCVAFTGAGVSALSGLPCFRDGGGTGGSLRESGDPAAVPPEIAAELRDLVRGFFGPGDDPPWEELFSLDFFEREAAAFYEKAGSFIYHDKEPSLVHRALAGLENRGLVGVVITQNIDMLHQKAGSRRVIELHGAPRIHYCPRCAGIRLGYQEAAAAVRAGTMPFCPQCGRPLKPAITLYGESLPLEARREAEGEAQAADLMLVLGTSLTVRPAADLPRTVLRRGGGLVIVNRQETPLDKNAVLRFWDLETVFAGLENSLSQGAAGSGGFKNRASGQR
ncbi:MAG: NAD-dependent deacetylase [Treponema sp.]|jgi:NAD-dependent deacetylase|nr:NAD-dependent deacetylase [Treponema sp.]